MKKQYKNAGITSIYDAEKAIRGGVSLVDEHGTKIHYEPQRLPKESPYRLDDYTLIGVWDTFREWQTPCEWYENIEKPVPCRVWDICGAKKSTRIEWIVGYVEEKDYPFIGEVSDWRHAEPINAKECYDYE